MGKSSPTTLYLVRHCQYYPENIIPGRSPRVGLSTEGKRCAQKLAEYFSDKHTEVIYTSPLLRCRQTAQIIGKKIGLAPHLSKLILEVKSPIQGMSQSVFKKLGGLIYYLPLHKKHGESLNSVFYRVKKFVDRLLKHHQGKNIIIVSHGDPIMILIYGLVDGNPHLHLQKTRPYIPKGGVIRLVFRGQNLDSFQQIFPLIS